MRTTPGNSGFGAFRQSLDAPYLAGREAPAAAHPRSARRESEPQAETAKRHLHARGSCRRWSGSWCGWNYAKAL